MEYIFRAIELARNIDNSFFWKPVFGIVLTGINLSKNYIKKLFLYDLYSNHIRFSNTGQFIESTWDNDGLVNEISKHCISNGISHQISNEDIFSQALKSFTWDVFYIELFIFYSFKSKNTDSLIRFIPILTLSITNYNDIKNYEYTDKDYFEKNILNELNNTENWEDLFIYLQNTDYFLFNKYIDEELLKLEIKDERLNYQRHTMLLRIGQYLSYSNNPKIRELGFYLKKLILKKLKNIIPTPLMNLLENSLTPDLIYIFNCGEHLNEKKLKRFIEDTVSREIFLKFFISYSFVSKPLSGLTSCISNHGPIEISEYLSDNC